MWSFLPSGITPFIPFLLSFNTSIGLDLSFPGVIFPPQVAHFVFLFALLVLSHCRFALRVITNNYVTQSILGCLEISVNDIDSKFFNLASGSFLGKGPKAATFFAKTS